MKRIDDGKVSLVEFLSSIKFAQPNAAQSGAKYSHSFAHFNPQARPGGALNVEDSQLIRSAN
jgi:hypothetical protein